MKNEEIFFLVLVAIAFVIILYPKFTGFLISSPSTPGTIDSCGVIDTAGVYILNSSVNTATTCFSITANNTTLNCNNSAVTGNKTGNGVESFASNITVINCIFSSFENGVYFANSSGNTLEGNIISESNNGISLNSSTNAKIINNKLTYNDFAGIYLWLSGNTAIINNTLIYNADSGVYSTNSNINMNGNNLTNNNWGVSLFSTNGSIIYNNYFENSFNAYDEGFNSWNISKTNITNITNIVNGSYLGGNFWRNYNGEDVNGDGIGDTDVPYDSYGEIEEGGDYLPLYIEGAVPEQNVIQTYEPNETELSTGYEQVLNITNRIKFEFDSIFHYVSLQGFTSQAVSLSIMPDVINFNLNLGEEKKFDLDNDKTYDLAASFIGIVGGLPEIKVQTITESVPQATTPTPTPTPQPTPQPTPTPTPSPTPSHVPTTTSTGGTSTGTILIILMVVILLGAGGFAAWYFLIRKKPVAPEAEQAQQVMPPSVQPGMGMPGQ